MRFWKLENIIKFICVDFFLVIIPGPINCANPFKNKIFPPIFSTPLETIGSILSVKMYSHDHICAFEYLSTMTVELPESNPIYYKDSNLEESIRNILSFEICSIQRVCFLCSLWEASSLPSNWFYLILYYTSCLCTFVLKNQPLALMI